METDDRAEVAFVVREDFQNNGIAGYLLDVLETIARENGYTAFSATVLRENTPMLRVFKKRYPDARITAYGGTEWVAIMEFDASQKIKPPAPG
jgi:GNAT superfamily N-acetyltransferase